MGAPEGFEHVQRGGDVVILHHGRRAAVVRGARAERFLAEVTERDPQQVMARWTGNYRHGNEQRGRGRQHRR